MKKLLILLILCLFPICGSAAEYSEYSCTPHQGVESVAYVALKNNDNVYSSLRDLTLMGIFRQERSFSLANYVTISDGLKMLFRCAGLEQYAYSCGEDLAKRAQLGVSADRAYSGSDGFFIAAYEKGLITASGLEGYFADKPGFRANDYATRGDVVVWLAKLFGIQPSYNYTALEKYGNTALIAPGAKPYFAGVVNSGIALSVNGSYKPCSLVKNSDLVTLLTRFYPYLLNANGIETHSGEVVSAVINEGDGNLTVTVSNGDTLLCTPENTCLLVGSGYADSLYMLAHNRAIGKKITYFVRNGKVIFVSTAMSRPAEAYTETFTGKLFFYDDLTGSVVLIGENGDYSEFFLADKAEIILKGESVTADNLMNYTDCELTLELSSCNEYSLKRIVRIEGVEKE